MTCRILVVNSNTADSVTQRIARAAQAALPAGCSLEAVSAPFGLPLGAQSFFRSEGLTAKAPDH